MNKTVAQFNYLIHAEGKVLVSVVDAENARNFVKELVEAQFELINFCVTDVEEVEFACASKLNHYIVSIEFRGKFSAQEDSWDKANEKVSAAINYLFYEVESYEVEECEIYAPENLTNCANCDII